MAVYTHITSEQLVAFLAPYCLGTLESFTGIAEGVSNSNYLLNLSTGKYILTLFEQRTNVEELPYFLALTAHFDARGIPCPSPVRLPDGTALGTLAGRPAVIVTFLPGKSVQHPDARLCGAAGRILADMHRWGLDFPLQRANRLGPDSWMQFLTTGDDGGDMVRRARVACSAVLAHWPKKLPQGAIHADFFPENVFFDDGKLCGVIDFYFACNDLLAYDLAIALNAWCADATGRIDPDRAGSMVRAYQAHRALTSDEIAAMPTLLAASALRFLATRQHDWTHRHPGALVTPKDPAEYSRILAFHTAHPEAFKEWL